MKNPYFKHEDFAFVQPLEQYLSFCEENIDDFIVQLLDMNTTYIKHYLDPLFHYGRIDILLPLNELVPYLLKDDGQKNWWKSLVKSMENSHIVCDFEEDFHSVIVNSDYYSFYPEIPYIWRMKVDYSTVMELAWETVQYRALDNLLKNDDLMGFIIPGFFSNELKADFLGLLDVIVLPKLLSELDRDTSFTHLLNTNEKATLKQIVKIISSNLDYFYHGMFFSRCHIILEEIDSSEKRFYELQNDDLRRLLFIYGNVDDYITSRYLSSIDRLISYIEFLKIDGISDSLKVVAALLHQCIGENDKANSLLLGILRGGSESIKYSSMNLVSVFRALSNSRYDDRSMFKSEMIHLWKNDDLPESLIITLRSIIKFFRKFSDELPERFLSEEYQRIIANASENVNEKALYIISPYLFENFAVVNRLQQFNEIICNKKNKLSERLYNLYLFRYLFESLVSHIGRYTRIDTISCFRSLWMDKYETSIEVEQAIKKLHFKKEILNVYSYSDEQRLKELYEQLKSNSSKLPSFVSVLEFEKLVFGDSEQQYAKNLDKLNESIHDSFKEIANYLRDINSTTLDTNSMVHGIDQKTDHFYEFLCSIVGQLQDMYPNDTEVLEKLKELEEYTLHPKIGVGDQLITTIGFLGSMASIQASPIANKLLELFTVLLKSRGIL